MTGALPTRVISWYGDDFTGSTDALEALAPHLPAVLFLGRPDDEFFATEGLCTHEKVHLSDGLVMDDVIECPKHNGRFNYKTGQALRAPVCVNLKTYPVKVEDGAVLIDIG